MLQAASAVVHFATDWAKLQSSNNLKGIVTSVCHTNHSTHCVAALPTELPLEPPASADIKLIIIVNTDAAISRFDKWWTGGPSHKATLHQSAIEGRGSTVVSASRVTGCNVPDPDAWKDGYSSSLVLPSLRRSVLNQSRHFFLSLMYGLLQSGLSSDRYSLICTVLSLG